ncbi:MAG: small multi-drug export protein [Bacilli bacterium]|nr:small multi-drug export protein [Bacilli bacterium]
METLVEKIVELFGGLGKEIVVFIVSLLPILELRGGLVAASILDLDFLPAYIISILGNVLPIPLVLLFLEKIFNWLKKFNWSKKIIIKLEKKILSKKSQIEKYGYLGLMLFVGIPLPGTGAWTGSGLAVLLHLDKKKSFMYIMLGVIMASIIMSLLSYGILDKIIR